MGRVPPLVWLLALLLLLPTTAGRALVGIFGGAALLLLTLSLVLGGLGWLGWKRMKSQFKVCGNCGTTNLGSASVCAACGSALDMGSQPSASSSFDADATPASSATIDVSAEDVES
ncbi:hypothetical protein ACLM44_10935 [Synechococcus sp. W2B2]|uniref:hypothetical protein n=1 Tax=unclassified Synechococcus TaxID=2626047 RepID=UPI0002F03C5B|nr:hypothetical protein [Synechococcus sp. WH 7805]